MRRRTARAATAALALSGGLAVWVLSTELFPYHSLNHDEAVYLQQAAMLLDGTLSLRPPVEGPFRPWFFVEDGSRLYPKYLPVPAAVFALGRLLGGYRVALVLVAVGNIVLVARIGTELFDRRTGLLAAALALASPLFLVDSSVFLSYAPTTLLNIWFAYAYLRADRTDSVRWAAAAGVAVGLAFFSRPYTAVLFALPFVAHALWTLSQSPRRALPRQATTAALGTAGVAVTLGYNALVTGSPLLFPYEAFAPLDGLGFGRRRILDHELRYTPELAVRANGRVLWLLFTEWVAGGVLGTALAAAGVARVARRRFPPRKAVLAGLLVTVPAGNVYFWGNYNILGDIDRAGDGLVAALGPYYHFDLLLPTAVFAAAGALWTASVARRALGRHLDAPAARAAFVALVLVGAAALGGVTAADIDQRLGENVDATATYEDAYEPFAGGPPANSAVLLPDPYGDWLNHPFQPLRNDPGFDGRAVYALDDRPFAVADAFPERTLYRYGYRGSWAPQAGSPEAARLQRVHDATGDRVHLDATLGIPDGADGVTVRVWTDEDEKYYVASNASDALDLGLTISDTVQVAGDVRPLSNGTTAVDGRDDVRVNVFVDYGADGFAYRLDTPVDAAGQVRALSPRVEYCRNARVCGGAATYVPETAPASVFVRTDLRAERGTDI
jgi:hypothetical protein